MRKTSLYLEDDVDAALARRAERDGITKAEVIRRALALAASQAPPRPLTVLGVLDFDAVPVDELDDELRRSGFGR